MSFFHNETNNIDKIRITFFKISIIKHILINVNMRQILKNFKKNVI